MPLKTGQTIVSLGTIDISNQWDTFQKAFQISIPEHSHYTKIRVQFEPCGELYDSKTDDPNFLYPGNINPSIYNKGYFYPDHPWSMYITPDVKEYATWQLASEYDEELGHVMKYKWVINSNNRQGVAWSGTNPGYGGSYAGSRQVYTVDMQANNREPIYPPEKYTIYIYSHYYTGFNPSADVSGGLRRPRMRWLKNVRIIVDYAEEYLAPTKPTSIGLSAKTSYGQAVTLSWSGSTQPRRLNPITGYQIQYSDNGGTWRDLTTVNSSAGYGTLNVQPELSTTGTVRRFRVRAVATESDALYSDWTECPDTLTKLDDTPQMDKSRIRLSKNWSLGNEVILSWANVSVYWQEENPIIRYEVQYIDSTGTAWLDYGTVTTSATNAQMMVAPPEVEGDYRRFRVRPVGKREAARYGAWAECRVSLARRGEFVSGESGEIHMPRLLDRNLREICTLYPIKCSVSLKIEPLSSASMTLLENDIPGGISVRQFVEVYTKQGSAGIYQIVQVSHDYGRGTMKLDLQHGLGTLSDALLPGTGNISGSVEESFRALLAYQTSVQPSSGTPYWQFGAYYGTGDYNINYEWSSKNLLEALCEMMEQMGDRAYLDFDQSEVPWKLNVMEFPPDISECRLSRNLTSVSVDVDSSLLCTRIYPYGAGEGSERLSLGNPAYIDADTKGLYGLIVRAEVVDNVTDAAVLRAVAEKFLSQHKHPAVSISLGAIDLSDATGEEVDGFHIGWTCRVPLPAYRQTYTEHITGIKWSDVYNAPDQMQLTLANESANVADSLADLLSAYETSALANKSLR